MKDRQLVVVLGGGLAGLSALWHLQKAGYDRAFLFEKESRCGGLARSEVLDGFTFDFTGHLLHFKNEAVKKLVCDLLGENLHYLARDSWIFSKGTHTRYPFQTNLYGLPPSVIKECILGFLKAPGNNLQQRERYARQSSGDYRSFEEWIYATLGEGIAKHFMVPYNQKLWTVPLHELTCEWMGRFVPQTSLDQILDGALSDQSEGIGYNALFAYPLKGGIEALPRAFAQSLRNVHLIHEVASLDLRRKRIIFTNGDSSGYDLVISSIPLPRLIRLISEVPSTVDRARSMLRFTSVYNINLGVNRSVSNRHWVYFPEPEFVFYRIGFSQNFSPYQAPDGCGSIYAEVAYSPWRPLERTRISERVKRDLIKAGILREDDRLLVEHCNDIPCAYVLYDQNYRRATEVLKSFVQENGILTVGRYGSWEYSGMEDAIWQGKQAAEQVLDTNARIIVT